MILHFLQGLASQLMAGVCVAQVTVGHAQVGQDDCTSAVIWPVYPRVDIQGFV